jgi:hypothetical protein
LREKQKLDHGEELQLATSSDLLWQNLLVLRISSLIFILVTRNGALNGHALARCPLTWPVKRPELKSHPAAKLSAKEIDIIPLSIGCECRV